SNGVGSWPNFERFGERVFRVTAEAGIGDDALAGLKFVHAGAELFDCPGEFTTGNNRQRIGRNTVSSFAQTEIGAVQRRSFHFDENIAGFLTTVRALLLS